MNLKELLSWDDQLCLQTGKEELDHSFNGLSPLEETEFFDGLICFVKEKKFLTKAFELSSEAKKYNASLIISQKVWDDIDPSLKRDLEASYSYLLTGPHVGLSMAKLSKAFYSQRDNVDSCLVDGRQMGTAKISPMADIAQDVFIAANVEVCAGAIIHSGVRILSDCFIGEDCEIFPNVTLYSHTSLGKRVRIHSNSVIGADGFGYEYHEGVHHKIWHLGRVEIGDDVEVGANSSIDKGTLGATRIGAGTKIDNLVQIGHNCQIGKGVIMCGQCGASGSAVIGDYTVMGGRAGVGPGVIIGKGSQLAGATLVTSGTWPDGSSLGGHPARPVKEWMKGLAYLRRASLKS